MLIKELFSEYIEQIPNSIGKGEMLKIKHTEDFKKMYVYASFDRVQSSEYIADFEKSIEKAMGLQTFSLICRYTPNLFSERVVPELVEILKRSMYVINGHLKDALYNFDGNTLMVTLKGAGYDMLCKAGFERELAKTIKEYFQRDVKVVLANGGVQNVDSQADYENDLRAYIANVPPPDYVPPENAAPSFDTEMSAENLVTVNYKDLPILSEGAEIVKGRKIDSPVINIADIQGKVSNITVWGDVFDYQEKEIRTKNGEKRVVSLSITDYTSSISIKSFENKDDENILAKFAKGGTLLIRGRTEFDSVEKELVFKANDIMKVQRIERMDNAEEKRVELHLHTNISMMD